MATWQDVAQLALALPEVVERAPHDWRVKDKLLAWERPLRKADLAALGKAAPKGAILGAWVPDLDTKEARLAARPDVFFTTPHFNGYPAVLVRLGKIGKADLRELLREAWLARAPKRLVRVFLERRASVSMVMDKSRQSRTPYGADIRAYHQAQTADDRAICELLAHEICAALPEAESKIWHRHPVWFLEGNPIVGYSRLKASMRLLFWSGQSFDEPGLTPEGTFKAAEARYPSVASVDVTALRRWLEKGRAIQWDYKNIVKRKGKLERIG